MAYPLDDYANIRIYAGILAYSPDGKTIAHVTNESGQFNIWLMPSGGGATRQLTTFTDNTPRGFEWSPDGSRLFFNADQNGDEQHQLYFVDVVTGDLAPFQHTPERQHFLGANFSPDGRYLSFSSNARVPTDMDIMIHNFRTGETKRITEGGMMFGTHWSPDGRKMAYVQFNSNTDQDIWVYDHETGEAFNATAHEGSVQYIAGPWKPDGSGFYVQTDKDQEFSGLAFYDLTSRQLSWVETPEQDIEGVWLAKHKPLLIWIVNEHGASKLRGKNLETGEALNLPDLPLGVLTGLTVAPAGDRLAMTFTRPTEAANLVEVDLTTGAITVLGESMLGGIPADGFVLPELIHYPTHDGRMIPAWLFKPANAVAPYPVMLSVHGGPEAQERPSYIYDGFYQYLVNLGFAVLATNIRGSTGYGKSYQKLIHRDWGGAELGDIEHAALYLRAQDWVDANRIAVFGGSFGGFATLSAVTRLPQYWAVGVDFVGPSNLVTFAKAVPPTWKRMMKAWVGDPEEDAEMLMERSPITYVDNLRAPLLVIQGAKDPRVVKAESDQMVERIRANGGDVTYYVDENEGHGATRRENRLKWWRWMADFLEERLLD